MSIAPASPLPSITPSRCAPWLEVLLLLLGALLVALGVGVGSVGLENLGPLLLEKDAIAWKILWEIRLPRTLGAWAAGALLGLAGALAQGLFRNPLADPYLLGSAAGASLGVASALALMGGAGGMLGASASAAASISVSVSVSVSVYSGHWLVRLGLTGAAFLGAVAAVLLTLTLARGVQHTLRLLLAGVVVGVVLGACTSLILLMSPDSLQAMQGFLLGSTGFIGWTACVLLLAVWLPCWVLAWALARALDALALGEATAHSLGLPLSTLRAALVALLALATGTAVAQTGLIAFVGLAAPHLVRAVAVVDHRRLMGLASFMGGVLLAGADLLARGLLAPQELPVGVLTAVLGGGYLLWLMHRRSADGPTSSGHSHS